MNDYLQPEDDPYASLYDEPGVGEGFDRNLLAMLMGGGRRRRQRGQNPFAQQGMEFQSSPMTLAPYQITPIVWEDTVGGGKGGGGGGNPLSKLLGMFGGGS